MDNPLLKLSPVSVLCADETQPEKVRYPYSTAHPTLCCLWHEVWLAENQELTVEQELAIPAKNWGLEELNMIILKNLVASGLNGGLLRTFGSIQWQCELYRGRPKAHSHQFNLDGLFLRERTCNRLIKVYG